MNLAFVLFLGGAVVIAWIYFWSRQYQGKSDNISTREFELKDIPTASSDDAVIVAREHGRLLYVNTPARQILNINGGQPNLEHIATQAKPADSFLRLFVGEGQSSFQLGEKWVEASSHRIPSENEPRTVVVIRELKAHASSASVLNINDAMTIVNRIGDTINVTLGVEQTLQTVLTILSQFMTFEAGEISLWDARDEVLYQRGWFGDTMYLIALAETGGRYELGEGITGWIAQNREPILISERSQTTGILPKLVDNPYNSFVGVPIELETEFIGTLELAHKNAGNFTDADMALLQAVAKPIAVSIYNASVYAQQAKRISDIASLQRSVSVRKSEEVSTDEVYNALNQRVAELLEADMCGILLYDEEREGLVIQLPVYGLPEALVRNVFIPLDQNSPQYEIWTNQNYWISNDVTDEPLVDSLGLQPVASLAGIINTAWMPLQLGDERIGVMAVSNKRSEGGFNIARDIQNLTVLASQAAIVIENVRLYEREKRMDTELVGLQEITNAIGALSHETEFYGEITERIARLMNIEKVGIMIYDPIAEVLRSQPPFYGVDDKLIEDYQIPLPPNSVMRELWEDERYWYSNRVQADTLVFETGLDELATKIGVNKTMIAVMQASGRRLGVVQVSDKIGGDDFSDSDARLLMIFATQAAAIIENARLFQEAQRSADQAQSLRRIAELAGNVLTSQESLVPVLSEIAELMQVEVVFVNVLDQNRGSLVTYPRWVYGADLADPIHQDIYSPGFEYSVAVSQKPLIINDMDLDAERLTGYQSIAEQMNLNNSVLVPLIFGDRTLGELCISNRTNGSFSTADLDVVQVVAAQIASALDRLLLYEATGENLQRRIEELDAIGIVSNALTETLDLDRVLEIIREESIRATGATDCTIILLHDDSIWPDDNTPLVERRIGYSDGVTGIAQVEVDAVKRKTEPVIITDYEFTALEPVPSTARSALAVPVLYQDDVVGVLHLFADEPGRFDDRASAFMMSMAVKGSLGYGNAQRYKDQIDRSERLRQRVDQLNRIFELGHMFQTNADPVSILEAIAYSVQQSVGFDTVVMLFLEEETNTLHRVAQAGMPLDAFERNKDDTISLDALDTFLKPEYRISESYFFPVENVKDWYSSDIKALNTSYEGNRTVNVSGKNSWNDGDVFIVQMMGPSGNVLGLMVLDRPHSNQRPDRGTVEVLEIFANQAASTIENTRLYLSSVANAEQEAQLNEMMESVSSTLEIEEIVRSVAQGTLRMLPFTRMTVALSDTESSGFEVIRVFVQPDNDVDIIRERRATLGTTALNRSFEENQDYVYHVGDDAIDKYDDLRNWYDAGEKMTLVLPLMTGGETLGVIHLGSDTEDSYGFRELRQLLKRMAQLVASSVQNARLFDQAVNLQILNESVVESIQQGIIVLDNSGHVISVNGFILERYGWKREAIGKDLFEYDPQMVEFLGIYLNEVLNTGTPRDNLNQAVTAADGQIITSNFYIYPLRFGLAVRGAVILVEDVTERSRLEQAMEARANQLAALTDVSSRITSSLERDEVVQLALEEMGWLIPHSAMTLWRRNGSYMVLEGATNLSVNEARRLELRFLFSDYDQIRQVVESQRVVSVGNGINLPEGMPVHEETSSWMGVPLVNQGHVVGMFMLTDTIGDAYDSKSDQNIAFAFGSQVAIALANADLFEQTFDRTNELGTLLEAAQATSLTTDLDSVFRTVVELMFSALDMDRCAIMTWEEVDGYVEVQLDMNREGHADTQVATGTRYYLEDYPARLRALRDREVVVIMPDDDGNAPYPKETDEMVSDGDHARMLVPLVVREQARGLIQLGTHSKEIVTQQKVRLARALGAQVAVAIENARLSAETTAHFEESLIINDLSRAISSTLNLEDMFAVVRDQVPGVTGAGELYLALYEQETESITFPLAVRQGEDYEIPPRQLNDDEVSFIIKYRRPLNLGADYYSPDELRKSLGIKGSEDDARSYLGVPLIAGDEVYGVLAVRDTERTRAFTINEQRILTTVGSQLGAAIQNARLFRQVSSFADDLEREVAQRTSELEDERDRIDTLYQITSELAQTLDMDQLMPRALGMLAKAVSAHDGVIMQLDPITDQLYTRASLTPPKPEGEEDEAPHPAERIARWIIMEDEHVAMVDDLRDEEFWNPDQARAAEWRSTLAVLLETNEELLGVMVFLSREQSAFHESHVRLMVAAANQVASSMNNAELYKMIREQADRLGSLLRAEQEEADKNKAILEGIADGVVLADTEGRIMLFNTAAEHILRIPRAEAINRQLSKITGVYGASAAAWAEAIEHHLVNPQDSNMGDYLDERIKMNERTISVHLSPVYTGERFLGTVSVFRDITREVDSERSKSEFVANVSHEFRTPLTSIKGYNDLLLMGAAGEIAAQQRIMLETVRNNVTRLSALVEDVLNISKIDSGREQLTVETVDVNKLIEQSLEHLWQRPNHQGKDLTVNFTPVDDLPLIQADLDKMTQAITNVIDNAFNYTLAGGTIDIVLEPRDDKKQLLITVHDTGVGIPEEFWGSIWERFTRHDDTAVTLDVAGTGLGLPIVKELVEMHRGEVWFESEEGVGTTFYIVLPYEQPEYLLNTVIESGSD